MGLSTLPFILLLDDAKVTGDPTIAKKTM